MSIREFSGKAKTILIAGVIAVAVAPSSIAAETQTGQNARIIQASGFNWLANGNTISKREARARQAAVRASFMSTRGGASWICSPAGFGQKSRCRRGNR